MIVKYTKLIADGTTYRLNTAAIEGVVELATIDTVTYVYLPDDAVLPEQPTQITVETVVLDDATKEAIKAASPHVNLINKRVAEKIAEQYSLQDEIKLLRTQPSTEFDAYNTYAEQCREWGRQQKAEIGLGI